MKTVAETQVRGLFILFYTFPYILIVAIKLAVSRLFKDAFGSIHYTLGG